MVATAITVAIFVPQIRFAMVTALLSGTAVAAALIALRRRSGPLSSDNDHPGAHGSSASTDRSIGRDRREGDIRVGTSTDNAVYGPVAPSFMDRSFTVYRATPAEGSRRLACDPNFSDLYRAGDHRRARGVLTWGA